MQDLDEIAAWHSNVYDRGLRIIGGSGHGQVPRLRATGAAWGETLSIVRANTGSIFHARLAEPAEDYVAFCMFRGRYRYEHGRSDQRLGPNDSMMVPHDGGKALIRLNDVDHRVIQVSQRVMHEVARSAGVESGFQFLGSSAINEIALRKYWQVAAHADRVMAEDSFLDSGPLVIEELARYLAAAMIETFPNTTMTEEFSDTRLPSSTSLNRAVAYIDAHYMESLPVSEVAEAVGVTTRALQRGFRRRFGMTPGEYIRQARLSWVHTQLKDADPKTAKATAIARRAGFHHYGTFARAYREMYGVSPSATLSSEGG